MFKPPLENETHAISDYLKTQTTLVQWLQKFCGGNHPPEAANTAVGRFSSCLVVTFYEHTKQPLQVDDVFSWSLDLIKSQYELLSSYCDTSHYAPKTYRNHFLDIKDCLKWRAAQGIVVFI